VCRLQGFYGGYFSVDCDADVSDACFLGIREVLYK
jgi:hypothetical protein